MSEEHKRQEGVRTKASTVVLVSDNKNVKIGGDWKFSKNPDYLKKRNDIW
jgi:hypothetical protein